MKDIPQNLPLMQLVVNGAIAVMERDNLPSEIIQTALYWLKFEIEDTLIPAATKNA